MRLLGKLGTIITDLGCLDIRAVQIICYAVGTPLSGHLTAIT